MSDDFKPFVRHDSAIVGLTRAVQCLTHIVYLETSHRQLLEEMLVEQRDKPAIGLKDADLSIYKSALDGVLEVIEQIKKHES